MSDCLFCKIANGTIPAKQVYESESVIAFEDIAPQAPVHVLVVPKVHVENVLELSNSEPDLCLEVMLAVNAVTSSLNISSGFRLVANTGDDGGQTVHHLHFHILGGRKMAWPPG